MKLTSEPDSANTIAPGVNEANWSLYGCGILEVITFESPSDLCRARIQPDISDPVADRVNIERRKRSFGIGKVNGNSARTNSCFVTQKREKMSMRLVTSDDIGLIKDVDMSDKSAGIIQGQSGADRGVTSMAWLDESESLLAVATTAGLVDILQFDSEKLTWTSKREIDVGEHIVVMRATVDTLFIITESDILSASLTDASLPLSKTPLENGPYTVANFMAKEATKVSETLSAIFTVAPTHLVAAVETRPPVIISLSTGKIEWSGKNANDTPLGISAKFHTMSMISISDRIFAAGDQSGKLRFYDIKTQRKPVLEMPIYDTFQLTNNYTGTSGMGIVRPITCLAVSVDSSQLFVGDTFGTLISLNIKKAIANNTLLVPGAKIGFKAHNEYCRKLLTLTRNFKGMMGSIRDLAVTASSLFVVTAGRYAYAFDLTNPKKMEKLFLKQKLTACLAHTKAERKVENLPTVNDDADYDVGTSSDDEAANDLLNDLESDVEDGYIPKPNKKFRR